MGTDVLGGYTTFSTASVETVRFAEQHRYGAATLNGLGTLAICTLAAAAGIWLCTLSSGRQTKLQNPAKRN